MRKIFALLLAALMLLSLVACNGSGSNDANDATTAATEAAQAQAVTVGFGRGDITADWPIGLQGYGNEATRISTGMKTYIYVICLAITDTDGETVLIMSIDAGGGGFEKYMRPLIEKEFGIPQDHVIVSAIHQHSTPIGSKEYIDLVEEGTRIAVQQALDDRAPATMLLNTVETTAMNFVRHYIANDGKGSIVGDNYNDAIGNQYGYIGHESDADPEMRLIKFDRGEDKKPIIVANFQTHPHMGSGSNDTNQHADWPGIMRDALEEELDCHAMYLSGAGGNLNSTSAITEENISTDWKHHGQRAANYVEKALKNLTEANLGDIKVTVQTNAYENDHSMDHLAEEALALHALRQKDIAAAHKAVKDYPNMHSVYHASAIVNKIAQGPTRNLTIGAIAIGDVVFTYHPYEMFDTNGMELRNGTVGNENYAAEDQLENPYPMTFVCTLGNGHLGYVPSLLGYTNGGYSTDIAYLAPGSGERLVGDYLAILNELHGN